MIEPSRYFAPFRFGALRPSSSRWRMARPEPGANTIVYLASSPEVAGVSGGYFYDCRQIESSQAAQDDAAAQRDHR
jgi:hypothetical protein